MSEVNRRAKRAFIICGRTPAYGEKFWDYLERTPFTVEVAVMNPPAFEGQVSDERVDLVIIPKLDIDWPPAWNVLGLLREKRPTLSVAVGPVGETDYEAIKHQLGRSPILLPSVDDSALVDALLELLFVEPARQGKEGLERFSLAETHPDVMRYLALHSEELFRVAPRFLENLIAELLQDRGWHVDLTPVGADDGIDVVAIREDGDSQHMMLVQVKRYARHRKVGVSAVRELVHVVNDARATTGMLVTTSGFTKPALDKQCAYKWRVCLRDHDAIVHWIRGWLSKEAQEEDN